MRLSMISLIHDIMNYQNRHEVLIIHDIMQKPNSIIVLLYIFHIIHPQKQKRSVRPFYFWEHSKGLSNQEDVERNICSRYCIYHVKFTNYCELIECSRPIRFFIVSLMYSNTSFTDIKFNCSLSKLLLTCTIITFIWTFLQLEVIKKTNNYLFIFLSAFIID